MKIATTMTITIVSSGPMTGVRYVRATTKGDERGRAISTSSGAGCSGEDARSPAADGARTGEAAGRPDRAEPGRRLVSAAKCTAAYSWTPWTFRWIVSA